MECPGNQETLPKGTTIEHTDAGHTVTADLKKLQTKTRTKVKTTCGTRRAIRDTRKYDCPEFVKEYKHPTKRGEICVDCAHEVETEN